MRDQLHVMELVDRYLDGVMNAGETATFETRLKESAELRALVDDQRALREGVQRIAIRAAVMSGARHWTWHKWWPKLLIGGVVVVVGVVALKTRPWSYWNETTVPPQQALSAPMEQTPVSTAIAAADTVCADTASVTRGSVATRVRVDTLVRTVQEVAVERKASHAADTAYRPVEVFGNEQNSGIHLAKGSVVKAPEDHTAADQDPQYPGGFTAMYDFLKQHIRYPDGCTMSGTVMVSFVIDEQGIVREPQVVQALEPSCDAEALRVITQLPRWAPATHDGKPVKSSVEVPLQFKYVGQVLKY